jgi:CRISPR/Cas system-associated exonuclease Cas4 (RecB family)
MLCERKRQESENLNNEISRLETLVNRFKSNDDEYLKIKKTVEEEIRSILIDGKVLLQFALASIIEAIKRNPANQSPLLLHIEDYKEMILDVANRLYDRLVKYFTNSIMDNTAELKSSSSQSKLVCACIDGEDSFTTG